MKLPLSLIKSFLKLDMPPVKIGETLTLLGIEVDRIYNEQPRFSKVVVGEVLSAKRHPDAKNLQIAEVNDGSQTLTVVCAGANCRAGIKTAFAKVGAILTDADGTQRHIEKAVLRGVESFGMLCAASELGLAEHSDGIMELPLEMKNGDDLVRLLWDPIFELSLTPNLGHCMSALGIARELSASLQIPIHRSKITHKESPLDKQLIVKDPRLCPKYGCLLIEDVRVGMSSFAIRQQLEACGQKPINSVVDATNYIMMKLGQPLHAFDADLLEGNSIEVGPTKTVEKFLGLDGVERELPIGTLVISDSKKIVAIAGVMGGANSAVSEKTTRVLLEAAMFDPISVRKTAKKIGLRSESSQRFEKGIDPDGLEAALDEAAGLIGGSVKGCAKKFQPLQKKEIAYRVNRVNQIIGTQLSQGEIEEIFDRLGFKVKDNQVSVPLYRNDIVEEIDLIEEVARIYGYNNIEKTNPRCTISPIPNDPVFLFENEMRRRLVGLGLTEFLTCDLISPKLAELSRTITPPSMEQLQTVYSKSEEYSTLRTSLLPNLLQVTHGNIAQKNQTIAAFEIGRIHFMQKKQVVEIPMAAILLTGKRDLPHWSHKTTDVDYYDLKGMVENIVDGRFVPSKHLAFHPGRQADIYLGDLIVGSFGEVHPAFLEKFGIEQRVYYAELSLSDLLLMKKGQTRVVPLPQFPSSERDWTIPLAPKMLIDELLQAVQKVRSPLLEKVELIDLYQPEGIANKNATLRFTYRDKLKTISFEEVETEHAKMMEHVAKLLAK